MQIGIWRIGAYGKLTMANRHMAKHRIPINSVTLNTFLSRRQSSEDFLEAMDLKHNGSASHDAENEVNYT